MSVSDAQTLLLAAAAGIAAVTAIGGGLLWLIKPRIQSWVLSIVEPISRKVDETHQMTTVNAHKSQNPTVLDRLDTMRKSQMEQAQTQAEQGQDIAQLRVSLEDHLMTSSQDSALYSSTLRSHTKELSSIRKVLTTQAEADKALWPAIEAVARAVPADFMGIDRTENDEYDADDDEEQP